VFTINYSISRNFAYRAGTLVVASDVGDSSTGLTYTDDYVENNNTGVSLTVTQTGDTVSIGYTTNELGVNGTISFSIQHFDFV
jgi:hypothetical protein